MKKFLIFALVLTSCRTNPVERLIDPVKDGDLPSTSGTFVIYEDELLTGGGLGFLGGPENQSIDLADTSSPRGGLRQMRYTWNGQSVNGQQLFAGFQLIITPDPATLSATPGKDLSQPGYTRLTMLVRGSLASDNRLRIEGPSNGDPSAMPARTELSETELTNSWKTVSLTVPATFYSNVKVYATFSIQFTQPPRTTNPGQGGTIYIDQVRYAQ